MDIIYISQHLDGYSDFPSHIGIKTGNIINSVRYKKKADNISIVLPFKNIKRSIHKFIHFKEFTLPFSISSNSTKIPVTSYKLAKPASGFCVYLIDYDLLKDSFDKIDEDEFTLDAIIFSVTACHFIMKYIKKHHIIHAFDSYTYLFPLYYRIKSNDKKTRLIHSVENVFKQFVISRKWLINLSLPAELYDINYLEYYGHINLLKGAIIYSDIIILNSKTLIHNLLNSYESTLLGDFLLNFRQKLTAVNNGIDYKKWHPSKDRYIFKKYSRDSLNDKIINKTELQERLKLRVNLKIPLIGIIIDYMDHDYIDLILSVLNILLAHPVQCILCSLTDKYAYRKLSILNDPINDNFYFKYGLDNALIHQIFAASDLFLFTPRNITASDIHLKAMVYGSIPIVNDTPHFQDHITDIQQNPSRGNGYLLGDCNPDMLFSLIFRSIKDFRNKDLWHGIMLRAISQDCSYKQLSKEYMEIYKAGI